MHLGCQEAAKKSRAAAAVLVTTRDGIRRSPATNIPELPRMVPGVQLEQINASTWAISVGGFNGEYSNKLLVLLDGRSVYLPTSSGVFWDPAPEERRCRPLWWRRIPARSSQLQQGGGLARHRENSFRNHQLPHSC